MEPDNTRSDSYFPRRFVLDEMVKNPTIMRRKKKRYDTAFKIIRTKFMLLILNDNELKKRRGNNSSPL